ncbi:ABC transporter permease [Intrasporangium chromatireducens Q5-1]|uniref:ABC transporter permease n=1 Tax=Intrasporangium chromatireducens Q5-1 TaxID=584657 RepID=W9GPU9_9MICO|nr:ABC transporter permease subunit [Intrasporangium chromatireducens]EWT06858.1 ABC transporter permease [Intrasporangium chromatireducens Q5-1]
MTVPLRSSGRPGSPPPTESEEETRGSTGERGRPATAAAFLLPASIVLAVLMLYPIAYSFVRSLFDASGNTFVGLGNYVTMFTDPETFQAIRNNVIWVVVAPTVVTALGLIFAVLTERVRWRTAFKLVIFMPMAISFLAAGIIFRLVYEQDPGKGVANAVVVGVHDLFSSSSEYPGARPRDPKALVAGPDGFQTASSVSPGRSVSVPLIGFAPDGMPKTAAPARPAPGSAAANSIDGVVWLDFAKGGGGTAGQIDPNEKGMPGLTVQAVQNGSVVDKTTTGDDGRFAFTNLKPGAYTIRLPASNFAQPFGGVTWLGPNLVTPAIIAAYVWMWAGFAMVLIAAGLSAIPRDALEAARVDGATEWQVFRRVTMPLLSPVLLVVFVTLVINVLKIFDLVYIMAPGSVQPEANVLALQMWLVSFGGGNNQGLGSALGVFLFVLVLPAMLFNIRRFRREEDQ